MGTRKSFPHTSTWQLSVSVSAASDSAAVVAVEVDADVAVVSCVASSLLLSLSSARPWL